jgi:ribonuclease HI
MLTLKDHTKITIPKARRAQIRVWSLMNTKGLSLAARQGIQVVAVQEVVLYGAELWWQGQKDTVQEVQKWLNEQGRRVTRCFMMTPPGPLTKDTALRPAELLFNYRVQRYMLRQMMMPDMVGGGRMIELKGNVVHRVEGIDELIRGELLKRRSYERMTSLENKKRLKGKVIILEEEEALEEAKREMEGVVLWMDGSRKEDEWVGCVVVWTEEMRSERWVQLGRQKEGYDAGMYAMSKAVKSVDKICREKELRRVMVFTDTQANLQRIHSDGPGPGQALVLWAMNWESELLEKCLQVECRWVPAHKGVEGNEKAHQQTTKAAYQH